MSDTTESHTATEEATQKISYIALFFALFFYFAYPQVMCALFLCDYFYRPKNLSPFATLERHSMVLEKRIMLALEN